MGSLSLNNNSISRMFLGNAEVNSAYFGSTLVYAHNTRNFNVKFYDINGTLLSTQNVGKGQSASAPTFTMYDSTYVELDKWTQPFSNVQCDLEIGAVPKTVGGRTYVLFDCGWETVTINIFKYTTDTTTINWGVGSGSDTTTTTSGYVSLSRTYTYGGTKVITITTDNNGGVALGNAAGNVFIVSTGALSNVRVHTGTNVRYLAGAFYSNTTKQPFILGVNNTGISSESNLFRNSNITTMTFGAAGAGTVASAFRDCIYLSKIFSWCFL